MRSAVRSVLGEFDIWIDIADADGNREKVLAKLDHLGMGIAAYEAALKSYRTHRVRLLHRTRIVRDSARDRPSADEA